MCLSMGSSPTPSKIKQPDTGPIKTAYEIPPELTEQEALKKKKGPKSLVKFGGSKGPQPSGTSFGLGSSYGGTQGVSGNPNA